MTKHLKQFLADESGQGFTEYALILALVSIGLIAVLGIMRDEIGTVFDAVTDALETAPDDGYTSSNAGA